MNPLFEKMMVPVHMMDRKSHPGPGGPTYTWTDGAPFKAAIVKDRSLAARVAEKDGMKTVYTITVPPNVSLDFHDVIKRDSDGATFRVTSDTTDSRPPEMASFDFTQVNAERWDIPSA